MNIFTHFLYLLIFIRHVGHVFLIFVTENFFQIWQMDEMRRFDSVGLCSRQYARNLIFSFRPVSSFKHPFLCAHEICRRFTHLFLEHDGAKPRSFLQNMHVLFRFESDTCDISTGSIALQSINLHPSVKRPHNTCAHPPQVVFFNAPPLCTHNLHTGSEAPAVHGEHFQFSSTNSMP